MDEHEDHYARMVKAIIEAREHAVRFTLAVMNGEIDPTDAQCDFSAEVMRLAMGAKAV